MIKSFKFIALSIFLLTLFFGFSTKYAYADTFTLSGHVQDSSGNAISGATVTVSDSANDNITTDNSGNYNLSIP